MGNSALRPDKTDILMDRSEVEVKIDWKRRGSKIIAHSNLMIVNLVVVTKGPDEDDDDDGQVVLNR
jgi:Ser-tRNA(Ala) deacylase AlaX